jgi:glycosyltransferase involved in cell wall biosynthesis
MRRELVEEFGVPGSRVTVIPFGINNAVPDTTLTPSEAKQRLGVHGDQKTILFFGNITPYKGLEYLVAAFRQISIRRENYRLIIAGKPDKCDKYWSGIREEVLGDVEMGRVLLKAEFIPDNEIEVYFKAADILVLPYRQIYQSGVLFLGQSFGLPVLAADVGSLKDDILEGKTGFTFRAEDSEDLARAIDQYFASELYADLNGRRQEIKDYANEKHSWERVSQMTANVYASLLPPIVRRTLRSA